MPDESQSPQSRNDLDESAAKTNPFSCNVCRKTYSRIDHLARHHRTHGKAKPFSCRECGKQFGRIDVLKRHLEVHGEQDGPTSKRRATVSATDARVSKACGACAMAKVKCDDTKPCRRCVLRGLECTSNELDTDASSVPQLDVPRRLEPPGNVPQSNPTHSRSHSNNDFREPSSKIHAPEPSCMDQAHQTGFVDGGFDRPQLQSDPLTDLGFDSTSLQATQNLNAFDPVLSKSANDIPTTSPIADDSSLADFLNGLVVPQYLGQDRVNAPDGAMERAYTHRDFLDFGVDSMDLTDIEFLFTDPFYNPNAPTTRRDQRPQASGNRTPILNDAIGLSTAAFTKSLWRYAPTGTDKSTAEQLHLSLPYPDFDSPETRVAAASQVLEQDLGYSLRDKILATVLKTCDLALYSDIVASFPSVDLLNNLLHHAINTNLGQIDSWLHLPTFDLNLQRIDLLIMLVAAGATNCSLPNIRKLGYALQEAVRESLRQTFENDNRSIRDLRLLQAFALELHVSLWSGDKRKMEIAESFLQPLVTMMRRGGRFKRQRDFDTTPSAQDSESDLQKKWLTWVELESYKRLAFHLLIHDSKSSMALQAPPLISHAEMTLDMPCSHELWNARSMFEWRNVYVASSADQSPSKGLTISSYLSDIGQMGHLVNFDVPLCAMIILHSAWHLIWDYLKLASVAAEGSPQNGFQGTMIANAWQQELLKFLGQLGLTFADMPGATHPEIQLIHQRMLLNLHISFEQVQLLAGKEGEEESRRVYPMLVRWSKSSQARRALWHAGQVLRAASQCTATHLRDIGAISLYHAGLTFWAYGVMTKINKKDPTNSRTDLVPASNHHGAAEFIWMDGVDCPAVHRYIALDRGTPVIRDWEAEDGAAAGIPLSASKRVMDSCISVLRTKAVLPADSQAVLPMVDKLTQLMKDLGYAANGVGRT